MAGGGTERGRTARGLPSEIEPPWSEPVGLVLTAQGEGLGYAPLCAPALRGPFTLVERGLRPHDVRAENGPGVVAGDGIDVWPRLDAGRLAT